MTQTAKREERGLFTQFPIILLDEYADKMPPTSLVAFMKFYRHFGYKGIFKGSVRKLCNVLKMAVGSMHRAIADWVKSGLVRKGEQKKIDENREEMVLLIEGNDLWKQNIEHSKSLGWCSNLEQSTPAEGPTVPENTVAVPIWNNSVPDRDKSVPSWDDFVPTSRLNYPPKITGDYLEITGDKKEERGVSPTSPDPEHSSFIPSSHLNSQEDAHSHATVKPDVLHVDSPIAMPPDAKSSEGEPPDSDASQCAGLYEGECHDVGDQGETPPPDNALVDSLQQSVMPNETAELTQKTLANWLQAAGAQPGSSWKEALDFLLPYNPTQADVQMWYTIVREQPKFRTGRVFFLNLAKPWVIDEWRNRLQQTASEPQKIDRDEPMTQVQADEFAKWLMQRGFAYQVVAIDKDEHVEQWYVCLMYEPGQWLYLEGPKHFNNPSQWEGERIEQAYSRSMTRQVIAG